MSKLSELTTFCNNLGKAFRKLTEDTENKFKVLEKEIKNLKEKNEKFAKDISEWDTEDLEERMIENEREFHTFKTNVENLMDSRNKTCEQNNVEHNEKISKISNEICKINDEVEQEHGSNSEEIEKIKGKMYDVTKRITVINGRIESLDKSDMKISNKIKSRKTLKCTHCDSEFNSITDMEKHLQEQGIFNQFKCDECEVSFHSEWRIKKHLKVHSRKFTRNCHYFNSDMECPYQQLGCKFLHRKSKNCKYGNECNVKMCQFRHKSSLLLY